MDPHANLAVAQALLGITLLAFLPLLLVTLLKPLRAFAAIPRGR